MTQRAFTYCVGGDVKHCSIQSKVSQMTYFYVVGVNPAQSINLLNVYPYRVFILFPLWFPCFFYSPSSISVAPFSPRNILFYISNCLVQLISVLRKIHISDVSSQLLCLNPCLQRTIMALNVTKSPMTWPLVPLQEISVMWWQT